MELRERESQLLELLAQEFVVPEQPFDFCDELPRYPVRPPFVT